MMTCPFGRLFSICYYPSCPQGSLFCARDNSPWKLICRWWWACGVVCLHIPRADMTDCGQASSLSSQMNMSWWYSLYFAHASYSYSLLPIFAFLKPLIVMMTFNAAIENTFQMDRMPNHPNPSDDLNGWALLLLLMTLWTCVLLIFPLGVTDNLVFLQAIFSIMKTVFPWH